MHGAGLLRLHRHRSGRRGLRRDARAAQERAQGIRQTLWRICSFYCLGALVLGMAVPHTSPDLVGATKTKTGANASPFVVAVRLAGIPAFPDVINACLLVFVLSAANSDVYIGSRTLYGLAKDGQAPALLARTRENGIPLLGVLVTAAFTVLGYMNASKSAATVFGYFVSLVTVFGTLNWISVLVSYVQFTRGMAAQGIDRKIMPYRGPLQPYGAYCALFVTAFVTFFNGAFSKIFLKQIRSLTSTQATMHSYRSFQYLPS